MTNQTQLNSVVTSSNYTLYIKWNGTFEIDLSNVYYLNKICVDAFNKYEMTQIGGKENPLYIAKMGMFSGLFTIDTN